MATLTIKLNSSEKTRLTSLAIRYGLSISELAKKVIGEISSYFPEESILEYKNPTKLKKNLSKSVTEYKKGKFFTKL